MYRTLNLGKKLFGDPHHLCIQRSLQLQFALPRFCGIFILTIYMGYRGTGIKIASVPAMLRGVTF